MVELQGGKRFHSQGGSVEGDSGGLWTFRTTAEGKSRKNKREYHEDICLARIPKSVISMNLKEVKAFKGSVLSYRMNW